MNSPTLTPATHRAHFAIGDERAAKGVVDVLTEIFFEGEAAVAAFERPDGRWDVTVHFAEAPDQALLRELVARCGRRGDRRQTIAFDTIEAKDWVKASLDDLVPVPGRALSSSTARTTARGCRRTSSASRSRRRSPSAPAITAPRAAASCCSTMS